MPSFDVVSRINWAELDNAINNTKKAISNRFDFRGATAEISYVQKDKKMHIYTEDRSKQDAIREMFESAAVKRGLSLKSFDWQEPEVGAAGKMKRDIKLREGLEQDMAKQVVKVIKESGLKVQGSIQGEEVRVTGKQRDDLQAAQQVLAKAGLAVPLQYVNMKD
jgi:cyclic-di-GMP-binding protein